MASHLMDKVEDLQVGKNIKETASALVSDVKEIAKDSKDAAGDLLGHAHKTTKVVLDKVQEKLS
jgi:hypothetical protein